MREIEFRAKRVDNDEWVFGGYSYCKKDNTHYITVMGKDHISHIGFHQQVNLETIGQYTNKKDKNKNKIFEGDILQVITGDGWTCPKGTKVYYEIVFTEFNSQCDCTTEYIGFMAKDKYGCLKSIDYLVKSCGAIIVDNIHDNPELLKEYDNEN